MIDSDDEIMVVERGGKPRRPTLAGRGSVLLDADGEGASSRDETARAVIEAAALLGAKEAERLEAEVGVAEGERRKPQDVNERTAAQDSSMLFALVPDPELSALPVPRVVAQSAPRTPPARPQSVRPRPLAKARTLPPQLPAEVRNAPPRPRLLRSAPTPAPTPAIVPSSPHQVVRTPLALPRFEADLDEPSVISAIGEVPTARPTQQQRQTAAQVAPAPRGRLVITDGEGQERVVYLNRSLTRIGRAVTNDIVLLDLASSRQHARIERHAEGFALVDAGSANGTWLGKKQLTRCELYDGVVVRIGETTLAFASVGQPRPRPAGEQERVTDPGFRLLRGRLPWTWALVWCAATTVGVVTAVQLTRAFRRAEVAAPSGVSPSVHYVDLAEQAIAAHKWTTAREELMVAQQLEPESQAIQERLAWVEAQVVAGGIVDRVAAELESLPFETVSRELGQIGADSLYVVDARRLLAEAKTKALARRLARARGALDRGQNELARLLAEEVLEMSPSHVEATALAQAAREGAGSGANPAGEDAETARQREELADAMRHYRRMRFADAAVLFESAARRQGSPRLKALARTRADISQAFARAWDRGRKAHAAGRADEARRQFRAALSEDSKLGAAHAARIKRVLAEIDLLNK